MPHTAEHERLSLESLRRLLGNDHPLVRQAMGAPIPAPVPRQPAPVRPPAAPQQPRATAPAQRPGGLFAETPAPPEQIAGLRAEAARIRKEAGIPEGGIRRAPGLPERATVLGLGALAAPEKQARELEDRAKQLEAINSLGARTLRAIGTVPRVGGTALSALTTGLAESAAPGSTGARPPGPLFEAFKRREGREPDLNESLSLIQDALSLPPGFQGAAEVVGDPFIFAGGFGGARGISAARAARRPALPTADLRAIGAPRPQLSAPVAPRLAQPPRMGIEELRELGGGVRIPESAVPVPMRGLGLARERLPEIIEGQLLDAQRAERGLRRVRSKVERVLKDEDDFSSAELEFLEDSYDDFLKFDASGGVDLDPKKTAQLLQKLTDDSEAAARLARTKSQQLIDIRGAVDIAEAEAIERGLVIEGQQRAARPAFGAPEQLRIPGPQLPRTPRPPEVGPRFREPETAVTKLTRLITGAKPVREQTEALKSAELRRRVAAGARILERTADPQQALRRSRGPLAGPLPRASFTPPESNLLPNEVTGLFEQIRSSSKQFFQRQDTGDALAKVLAGEVPTRGEIALLEEMFGTPLAKAILGKRTLGARAREAALDTINLPRSLVTAYDASAPFRQGVVLSVGHPIRFTKNIVTMFKAMARERNAVAIDDAIRAHPNFQLFTGSQRRNPLFIAERTRLGTGLAAREEAFMSRFAQRIPGIRQSERAYVTFLNKLRFDVANDVYAGWQRNVAQGGKAITERDLDELMLFLNRATGRGGLGPLENSAPILNATFFSPRLQTSRISLPMSLLTSTPRVRQLVAKDLSLFVGTGLSILALLDLSGAAEVETDCRSSDFGKLRFGKTRIDFWGGFLSIARFTCQLITNERKSLGSDATIGLNRGDTVARFLQSKLSPTAGFGADILTGRTFLGEELTPTIGGPSGVLNQAKERLAPFFIRDMVEAVSEQGLTGGLLALSGGLGTSVQTFGTVEDIAQRDFNVPFTELWPFEKDMARATFGLESNRTSQGYFARIEELDDGPQGLNSQLNELAASRLTARQKRNEYFDITAEFANRRNEAAVAAFGNEDIDFDPNEEDDNKRSLGEYYQALELSKTAAGRFTTAEWNRRLDALVNQWTFGQREYVRANTHTRDVPDRLLRILPATTRRRIRQSEESREAQLRRRGVLR